ncbi:hypothetical protein KW795_02255 [Candidatus Microgenomates bacterium]|nr:hypothetical protein [Candidatus Microgenomates bacterium]
MADQSRRQSILTLAIIIVVIIALVFGIILGIRTLVRIFSGVRVNRTSPNATLVPVTIEDTNTNIETVKPPENQYSGSIRFAATVDTVLGVKAFTVRSSGVFKDGLLIVSEDSIAPIGAKTIGEYLIHSGDRLLIDGRIYQFDTENFRRTSGINNFPTVNLGGFNGQPVIVAGDIDRIQ